MRPVYQLNSRLPRPMRPARGRFPCGRRGMLLVALAIGLIFSVGDQLSVVGPSGNWVAVARGQQPANSPQPSSPMESPPAKTESPSAPKESPRPVSRLPVEEARRQAELLHAAIHATLQIVHDRYYQEDEGLPLPAAVLSNAFADLEQQQNVKLRWLAVEGQAMNTDHKPQNEFELQAVQALKSGKPHYERAEEGVYQRVGTITLHNHCLKCHVPDRKSTRDRAAGLIISIPVLEK